MIKRQPTRPVRIGTITVGADNIIAVQSMCATKTRDIDATVAQTNALHSAGAGVVRIAIDNKLDVEALREIRKQTKANLVVDLQEAYQLAKDLAPHVDKIRYNPGHLHHFEKEKPVAEKVRFLVDVCKDHDIAMRIGVNCGSTDPEMLAKYGHDDNEAIVQSALMHVNLVEGFGFTRFVVSIKDSDPKKVVAANTRFAQLRPDVPLHLGVTEAGMPPDGVIKTRIAFEQLLSQGIGDTLRVSLTVPNPRKPEEIQAGQQIITDVIAGRFRSIPKNFGLGLNIISCPSCSRVENEKFVELAEEVKRMSVYAAKHKLTIAVMGCRVNGPGETDDADLGLWCGPSYVNLKKKTESLGAFSYEEIVPKLKQELDTLVAGDRF